jgi:hypothetical protein
MKRIFIGLLCVAFLASCGSPPPQKSEKEIREQEEREAQDQGKPYKAPDGAFGAKDYANEAKQSSDQATQELEQAASDEDSQDQ